MESWKILQAVVVSTFSMYRDNINISEIKKEIYDYNSCNFSSQAPIIRVKIKRVNTVPHEVSIVNATDATTATTSIVQKSIICHIIIILIVVVLIINPNPGRPHPSSLSLFFYRSLLLSYLVVYFFWSELSQLYLSCQ